MEHIPQTDAELITTYFKLALDGFSQNFRTKFSMKNGKQIAVMVHFSPVESKEVIVGVYATLKDMAELDKVAKQYIESENRFRIIAENAQ